MNEVLAWHRSRYPLMTEADVVKLFFQGSLGCGHLLGSEEDVTASIVREAQGVIPDASMPLTEDLPGDYVRLYLAPAKAANLSPLWIARLMLLSSSAHQSREDVCRALASLEDAELCGSRQDFDVCCKQLRNEHFLPSHSEQYRTAYAPAYRVISKETAKLLPALQVIAKKQQQKQRLLIAIDGPCASGKTTFSERLSFVLGHAPVVHMDDFYVPHAMKTPERLAQPGGNADIERFCEEVLHPLLQKGHASYRPYSCHLDQLMEPVDVPEAAVTIIEGAYALHPKTSCPYDVAFFLTIPKDVQEQRIRRRNGDQGWAAFRDRWIPLEQQYFDAFHLPNDNCTVLTFLQHEEERS